MNPYLTPSVYTPCHYTTSRSIFADVSVNVTFEQILGMSDDEWVAWLGRVRLAIRNQWDKQNIPPRVGLTDAEIGDAWDRLASSESDEVWTRCDDGGEGLFVSPTSHSVLGQWFPTMMKTRINYSAKDVGISIYDMFADDATWERYSRTYAVRHFRRDSFYAYSHAVHASDPVPTCPTVKALTAEHFLELIRDHPTAQESGVFDTTGVTRYGLWLAPAPPDEDYNGYGSLLGREIWTVTKEDAVRLRDSGKFPRQWFVAVGDTLAKKTHYMVRLYDTATRMFPGGYKSFRISICQYAVNFPALVARALYERYTYGVDSPIVWDPSAGWGGRLVGALTARRSILYVGTDPNEDHLWTDEQGVKHSKYTELAAYHASRRPFDDTPPNVMFFPCGSEVIYQNPTFRTLRGKVNVVFTSPPYFNREAYSEDESQSYKKFSTFPEWSEGFLQPTIETAAEWLAPGGYLLWNVADIKQGNDYLPLEAHSVKYATQAGLRQIEMHRLLLASMSGANRISTSGQGTARNTTVVKGRVMKYEPIFVFQKPF